MVYRPDQVTTYIPPYCYIAFFILALASPFMPVYLAWRSFILSIIVFTLGQFIEGPIHWSDQDLGYAIGISITYILCTGVALHLILKIIIVSQSQKSNLQTNTVPDEKYKFYLDAALLLAAGCMTGLWLTSSLCWLLADTSGGANLDTGIAVSAYLLTICSCALSRKRNTIFFSAAFFTLAISASIGSFQTSKILKQGEAIAGEHAWCLATSVPGKKITDISQLGFFSLSKTNTYPHLGLLIQKNDHIELAAHWSIRQQSFTEASGQSATCSASKTFSIALENNKVEKNLYTVGFHNYSIPAEYQPIVYTDRLSIRTNLLAGPNSKYPKISERIELRYNQAAPSAHRDAESLEFMPNPRDVNVDDLISGKIRFSYSGTDQKTGQQVLIECLRGAYADRNCDVQVYENTLTYSYLLPFQKINRWEAALTKVKKLFATLQLS